MAEVIAFSERRSSAPKRTSAGGQEAAILLFTGIRYERAEIDVQSGEKARTPAAKPSGKAPPTGSGPVKG